MKHKLTPTLILIVIFLITQLFGIGVIYNYIDHEETAIQGETVFKDLPIGERPEMDQETSFIPIILVILAGTVILLLLIKFKAFIIWKLWFLMAVFITSTVSLGAFMGVKIALVIALIMSVWKVFKPNPYIHNFSEIFVYAGLAAVFVPIFNLTSIVILLLLISAYDAYAVWKSKHMIVLAKAQSKANIFAGLLVPYNAKTGKIKAKKSKKKGSKKKGSKDKVEIRNAILGGGDIGFPLIFAGVILKTYGVIPSLVIPVFSTMALIGLFYYGEKNKFYPAMPFMSAACFLGLAVVWLVSLL